MPLLLIFLFVLFQSEFSCFFNSCYLEFFFSFFDFNFLFFSVFGFFFTLNNGSEFCLQDLSSSLNYNYNFRTYFTQTYLHAAFNEHMKPYRNITRIDKLFGDYNTKTYRKAFSKHARGTHAKELFTLLYSFTFDYYALVKKDFNPILLFYFKKQHLYSVIEMFYAALYLGMIYFLSFVHIKNIEESSLLLRETEEVETEYSQSHWYYFRESRRGIMPPKMHYNAELDFFYPHHPYQ